MYEREVFTVAKPKGTEKKRVNISIDADTLDRLRQYAYENHIGNGVSGAITDLVWKAKVKNAQIRGQRSIEEI